MNKEDLITKMVELFEDTDPAEITANTDLTSLDEWDSLMALSIMAMVKEEFNVKLTGDEIRNLKTIEEVYNTIQSKL